MEQLDSFDLKTLLKFFNQNKTELSHVKRPLVLLSKMRDYDLILQEKFEEVSVIKDKRKKQDAIYNLLDRFSKDSPKHIRRFWECVFCASQLQHCPTLERIWTQLISEAPLGREEKPLAPGKKKEKTRHVAGAGQDQQPSSSTSALQNLHAESRPINALASPGTNDGQTSARVTFPLRVTCGALKGKLYKKKYEKGEASIFSDQRWYTPKEFVKAAGKGRRRWTTHIRYKNGTMEKLLQDRHLQSSKRPPQKQKKKPGGQLDVPDVFEVTSGASSGKLHKSRFASGSCGKSVRTKKCWMTPEEFVTAASHVENPTWSSDIQYQGLALGLLVQKGILQVHRTGCDCRLCKPSFEDLRKNKNDDKCCLCKDNTEDWLVLCMQCPRAFHGQCHLPQVEKRDIKDWLCTICTFERRFDFDRLNRSKADKTELLKAKIKDYKMQCQYLLLYLYSSDEDGVLPGYKTLLSRLQEGQIQTIGEFDSKIKVLFIDSQSHYQGKTDTLNTCNNLMQMFNRKFDEVFNVQ